MSGNKAIVNNRYVIEGKRGQGGMGVVYRAYDRLSGQTVALKQVLITKSDPGFSSRPYSDSSLSIALATEFRTLAGLRHPNIISVLDYGFTETQNLPFFTMEYLDKAQSFLEAARTKAQDEQIELLIQLFQALAYLHRHRTIHCDLKPDNVMVIDGQVKTLDFGLAMLRQDTPSSDKANDLAGTFVYLAPEIFGGSEHHRGSDLWAAGIMMYELFAGHHPFNPISLTVLMQNLMAREADVEKLTIPEELKSVLARLLSRDRDERYDNAIDVIDDLYRATGRHIPDESKAHRESFIKAAEFVGRKTEFATLLDALENAKNGQGRGILIGGESGVGKSRLLEELRTQALVRGFTVLRGQAVSGRGLPFQLWRDVMRHMVLALEIEAFDKRVLKEIVPDIETLLDEVIEDAPVLDSSAHNIRLMLSIVGTLRRYSKPALLILEDLQWASGSLKVLENLLLWVKDLPLLVIGSYRNDEAPDLPQQLNSMSSMMLSRLDEAEIETLSESILGTAGTRPELLDVLKRETEGNCFFLVEVMRVLAEDAGRLANVGQMTIPAQIFAGGIREAVQRRLDRLPETIQTWLQMVALAGRKLDLDLIGILSKAIPDWQRYLTLCADAAVLEIVDGNWRFSHDKMREILIRHISEANKPAIHRQIAEAIEALYPGDADYDEALRNHWQVAGHFDKELIYLEPVAKKLTVISGDYDRAEILLESALTRLPEQDARAVWILNAMARLAEKQGNYDNGIHLAKQAEKQARQHHNNDELATSLVHQAWCLWRQGNFAPAGVLATQGLEIAREQQNGIGQANALNVMGNVARMQGKMDEAQKLYQQSLKLRQEHGDKTGIAISLNNLGIVATNRGQLDEAHKRFQEGLELMQELGDKSGIGTGLNNLGLAAMYQGNLEEAQSFHKQSLEVMRELGHKHGIASSLNNLGLAAVDLGNIDEAQNLYQQALELWQEIGDKSGIASTLSNLGVIASYQDNLEEAQKLYRQSLELLEELGYKSAIATTLGNLGTVILHGGNLEEAQKLHQQSLELSRELEDKHGIASSLNDLGIVARMQDNLEEAQKLHQQSLELFQESGDKHGIASTLINQGWVAFKQNRIESRDLFRRGLMLADENRAIPQVLESIAGFAALLTQQGQAERAAGLIGLVQDHPANEARIQQQIDINVKPLLETTLSSDELDTAIEAGNALDLDTVVQKLLNEFSEGGAN